MLKIAEHLFRIGSNAPKHIRQSDSQAGKVAVKLFIIKRLWLKCLQNGQI